MPMRQRSPDAAGGQPEQGVHVAGACARVYVYSLREI